VHWTSKPANLKLKGTMLPKSAANALRDMHSLGETLKLLEKKHASTISPNSNFIVRLDGVAFSTFTKDLTRPFDWRLMVAMMETTSDLISKFNCSLAYTQSDEISLVFPAVAETSVVATGEAELETDKDGEQQIPAKRASSDSSRPPKRGKVEKQEKTHMYAGRSDKIVSTLASYASARLNFHLSTKPFPPHLQSVKMGQAYFDARIVECTPHEAVSCIWWRSGFDGLRNAIGIATRNCLLRQALEGTTFENDAPGPGVWEKYNYPKIKPSNAVVKNVQKRVSGMGSSVAIHTLASLKCPTFPNGVTLFGPDAYVPPRFLWGTFFKKEKYLLENCIDPRTNLVVSTPVLRTRVRFGSWNWADWTPAERAEFVFSKFWPKSVEEYAALDDKAKEGLLAWNEDRVPAMDDLSVLNA